MKLTTFFVFAILFFSMSTPVFAVTVPTFPLCTNPQGEIQSPTVDGIHGIVGSTDTYVGKDTVYKLSNDTLTQCFCSESGTGIQTDWWNASSLTEDEINVLKSLGWHYVPAGNLWGLDSVPYVAKNTSYSCLPTTPPSDHGDGKSDGKSDGRGGVGGGGQILGISTGDVLGLATTGNMPIIVMTFFAAISLLILGIRRSLRS